MSDFLFSSPKLLNGAVRIVDFGGYFDRYNVSPTPEIADQRAARCDWLAVLRDLYSAAHRVAEEESGKEQEEPVAAFAAD